MYAASTKVQLLNIEYKSCRYKTVASVDKNGSYLWSTNSSTINPYLIAVPGISCRKPAAQALLTAVSFR
ncbi:MAG: hypothetical protein WCG25_01580 [bacterium]